MPFNLKSTYFSLKTIHFLSFKHLICHLCCILNKILKFLNFHIICILFLFTICTVSQLFWNRVCTCYDMLYVLHVTHSIHKIECMKTILNKMHFVIKTTHFVDEMHVIDEM